MKKSVITLGINDGHNSGAAIVQDGEVKSAIQEERLRNIKNFSGVPELSIKAVFDSSGINPVEIDVIALVSLNRTYAPLQKVPLRNKLFAISSPLVHGHTFSNLYVKILHRFRKIDSLKKVFKELGLDQKNITFIEHHGCHAACAYYQRPWDDDSLVLTLDGAGDGLSATISTGNDYQIERIASTTYYDSPGNNFYSEITGFLGFKRWEHEYKLMGMAPYGRYEYCIDEMRKIIRINPKKPLEFQNTIGAAGTRVQGKLRKLLALQRFDNIAAACQKHFEDIVTQWVKNAIKETDLHKVACAGGMFLNVKANKLIREMEEVEDVFFYPASDDGGTPVGAALEAYYRLCEQEGIKPTKKSLEGLYYGMLYTDEEVKAAIKSTGWQDRAQKIDDIESEIAELVSKGKVIARFSGKEEWGPRSLGNRSIIANPSDLNIIRKINFAIKMRDFWMPFAPSILKERIDDYIINPKPAYYMIEAFDTKKAADEIIAGLHPFDRTARPQTVNEYNPSYKRIIENFQEITGIGGVLNTSFNLHGYPICGTPKVAIDTLDKSGLDGLAINNYLLIK
jgi:carbamoyltransferase